MKVLRMIANWLILLSILAVFVLKWHWCYGLAVRLVHWKLGDWINAGTRLMATCSIMHTFLPPWDWEPEFITDGFADFPGVQRWFRVTFHNRYYKAFIYVIGFIAVNIRSVIWRYISTQNPNGPNANNPVQSVTVATAVVETQRINTNPAPPET